MSFETAVLLVPKYVQAEILLSMAVNPFGNERCEVTFNCVTERFIRYIVVISFSWEAGFNQVSVPASYSVKSADSFSAFRLLDCFTDRYRHC